MKRIRLEFIGVIILGAAILVGGCNLIKDSDCEAPPKMYIPASGGGGGEVSISWPADYDPEPSERPEPKNDFESMAECLASAAVTFHKSGEYLKSLIEKVEGAVCERHLRHEDYCESRPEKFGWCQYPERVRIGKAVGCGYDYVSPESLENTECMPPAYNLLGVYTYEDMGTDGEDNHDDFVGIGWYLVKYWDYELPYLHLLVFGTSYFGYRPDECFVYLSTDTLPEDYLPDCYYICTLSQQE